MSKYNRIGLWFAVAAMVITGLVYYFTISYILNGQVDQDLVTEEKEVLDYVKSNGRLPAVLDLENLKISFEPSVAPVKRAFRDAAFFDKRENETESGRQLTSSVVVQGKLYRFSIIESKAETDDLAWLIFEVTLMIIAVLLTGLFVLNRLVVRQLWQPFYAILSEITRFNLTDQNNISKINTRIDEFRLMNDEITSMSSRVIRDYQDLKNFTENAAHELMTPLSLVNFKMDNLVQEGLVSDRQGVLVEEIYQTLAKMKKLNKSMLMLARIENRLFDERESIDLANAMCDALKQFEELFRKRGINVSTAIGSAEIVINADVLPVLLNNLLSNAASHNCQNGKILITVSQGYMSIANTGTNKPLDAGAVFQRFYKAAGSEGTGLGLTLIKEICDTFGIILRYDFHQGLHIFELTF
ncbi:HAMP domain-containing sensor histidine kinase [Mucilaginibacter sp. L3T2-6]|uniref:sensor histidine kinase n=1 Tax=Mucilaginibacter sp. L3T2-6 TaxID=3062491 RepID=UPI002675DC87|nr:HAMP domain-containing sensor histidine kinase [Mucilaginibacter sp. L3T2-6]MDO3641329.1 HAMP domain-containing sensor histidine kinase [Mucilaginibacter sp. L3T2-6]MDV6213910.1 HAMP domain-containing sensor histidine kinase [Mucilaginibacter sp. L3T2-6]